MFEVLKKINNVIEYVLLKFLIIIMSILIISTFLQVFSRYVLKNPFVWTTEVSTFVFIWMVFMGASVGVKRCDHFVVEIIYNITPQRAHKYILIFSHLCILSVSLILLISGYKFSLMGLSNVSSTLRISMFYMYCSVFLSGLFMTLFSIENIIKIFKKQLTISDDKVEEI